MAVKTTKIKKEPIKQVKIDNKHTKKQIEKLRESESLYINKTKIDENVINKFYRFYNFRIEKFDCYAFLVSGIILIAIGIIYLIKLDRHFLGIVWNIIINTLFIMLGIIFVILALKSKKYNREKTLEITKQDVTDLENKYYFYDDILIIVNEVGETETKYKYIEKIYESRNYYYIFTNQDNAYILDKCNFTKGDQYKFEKFIDTKVDKIYKKLFKIRKNK